MNLEAIRTFLAIIETGSLVGAAGQLNVTQSTITARLKTLENELGQTLIQRNKSGASLTNAGQRLQRYAETITDLWKQAQQETSLPDGLSGACNLACHPDLWPQFAETMYDHIRHSQPDIALSIWTGGQHDLSHWLASGRVDVALSYWPVAGADVTITQLGVDHLVLVGNRPDRPHRFDPGYVFVEAGDAFGRDHAAAFADANTARLRFGSAQLGLSHLLHNGGSGYLPERIARQYIDDGRLFALQAAPKFTRPFYLITRKGADVDFTWLQDSIAKAKESNLND